jgi:hypothetical protein
MICSNTDHNLQNELGGWEQSDHRVQEQHRIWDETGHEKYGNSKYVYGKEGGIRAVGSPALVGGPHRCEGFEADAGPIGKIGEGRKRKS